MSFGLCLPASHFHPYNNVLLNRNIILFTLYSRFVIFFGLLGTAFSVLIRLELSGPGVQYIADNQLYNSIITAYAILMIIFCNKYITGLVIKLGGQISKILYKGSVELLSIFTTFYVNNFYLEINNNVVKSSMFFLDVDTLQAVGTICGKMVPVLDTYIKTPMVEILNNTSLNTISSVLTNNVPIDSIDRISSKLAITDVQHISMMEYLANNYKHINNMEYIALSMLSDKSQLLHHFNDYNYLPNIINSSISNTKISIVNSSLYHDWNIHISSVYTVWSNLYKYSFYFIPLLVPLFNTLNRLIFNMLEQFLNSLNYFLRFLIKIINSSLLFIIYLIELLLYIFSNIANNGVRITLFNFFRWLIDRFIFYIGYLRICLYCNKWLSFYQYNIYVFRVNYVSSHLNEVIELHRNMSLLVWALSDRVSNDIFIVGHAEILLNNVHGNHILTLQISTRIRWMYTRQSMDRRCRIIAALYAESGLTPDQRVLLANMIYLERWMLLVNPNYISEFFPLNTQIFELQRDRGRIRGNANNNINEFMFVDVYDDGYVLYRYMG